MELVVDFQGGGAERLLHGMHERLDHADQLLGVLVEDVRAYEEDVFATSGHGQWAPNDPATVALKGHGRVLVDTGGLLDELTDGSAITVRGEDLTLESRSKVAGYLKRGARGAPRRDPAPPPESDDRRDWAKQLLAFAVDGRRR